MDNGLKSFDKMISEYIDTVANLCLFFNIVQTYSNYN
jgi:hypothetical protein